MFKRLKDMKENFRLSKKVKIFTYGTLKENERNNYILSGAKFVDIDKIYGYRLYDTPYGFPCVKQTNNKSDVVFGEVYEVSVAQLESTLDYLEGYYQKGDKRNLYNRYKTKTHLDNDVWIYEYARNIQEEFIHLESGIWTGWINKENYNM